MIINDYDPQTKFNASLQRLREIARQGGNRAAPANRGGMGRLGTSGSGTRQAASGKGCACSGARK